MSKRAIALITSGSFVVIEWVIKPLSDAYIQKYVPTLLPAISTLAHLLNYIRPYGLGFVIAALFFSFWDPMGYAFRRWILGQSIESLNQDGFIYVGYPTLSVNELEEKRRIEVAIFCFNAQLHPVRLVSIEGPFSIVGRDAAGEEIDTGDLSAPIILFDRGPEIVAAMTEFLPVIHQPLSENQAKQVAGMLLEGLITLRINFSTLVFERADLPHIRYRVRVTRSPNLKLAAPEEHLRSTTAYVQVHSTFSAIAT